MPDASGLRAPQEWYWHVAVVFSVSLGYALVCGGQILLGDMIGLSANTKYLLLGLSGIMFGLFSAIVFIRQCANSAQFFAATRNCSIFPACFSAWVLTTITSMQEGARQFALENAVEFKDPFGPMIDPVVSGLIILLAFDIATTPFMYRYNESKIPLVRYEISMIAILLIFVYMIKTIGIIRL